MTLPLDLLAALLKSLRENRRATPRAVAAARCDGAHWAAWWTPQQFFVASGAQPPSMLDLVQAGPVVDLDPRQAAEIRACVEEWWTEQARSRVPMAVA